MTTRDVARDAALEVAGGHVGDHLQSVTSDDVVIERPVDHRTLTKRYTEEAVRFIGANRAKPFLLYIAHSLPHIPLARSSEFVHHSDAGFYGDVVEEIDAGVGRLLDALEIAPGDVRKLQQVPWTTLLETQAGLEAADRARGEAPRSFAPVVDGITLPRHPWDPDAPSISADVPMIVASTLVAPLALMLTALKIGSPATASAPLRAVRSMATAFAIFAVEDALAEASAAASRVALRST